MRVTTPESEPDVIDIQLARRIVDAVNAEVDLVRFLTDEGFFVQDPGHGRSIKNHCPWGWTHPDGGYERALRVYDTNTAFCFAGCGYIDPVIAASRLWDVPRLRAAKELSMRYGVSAGDLDSALAVMAQPRVDVVELVDAMRRWVAAKFSGDELRSARVALARCASVVELVSSDADAAVWWSESQRHIEAYASREREHS